MPVGSVATMTGSRQIHTHAAFIGELRHIVYLAKYYCRTRRNATLTHLTLSHAFPALALDANREVSLAPPPYIPFQPCSPGPVNSGPPS